MSAEVVILFLVAACAPPLTLFPFIYAWVARGAWWTVPAGRAIMISTTSLAALVDLTLARRALGDYPYREEILAVVMVGICAGAWLKFGALIHDSYKGRRDRRARAEALTDAPLGGPTHVEQ